MKTQAIREQFESFLQTQAKGLFPNNNSLSEAVLYSLLAPGKRIRPLLCLGFCQGLKGNFELALRPAMAVEMIHAYSLIHDDLPAMDNDDFRRGRPTNHKVFGEALAILAGDSLLTVAPQYLLRDLKNQQMDSLLLIELVSMLLESSGHLGMVEGQALDMKYEAENHSKIKSAELETILKNIHEKKTGALISWSCVAGLYATNDRSFIEEHRTRIREIGLKIGLLFQMVDDVLDVTASLSELGKTPGKDEKAGKLTYTNLYGLDGAVVKARELALGIQKDLRLFEKLGDWALVKEIVGSLEQKLHH